MRARERLRELLKDAKPGRPWKVPGRTIAEHYKRITIDEPKRLELANIGGKAIFCAYKERCYFNQAVIAGAALSGEYDRIDVISPWQFGKSWLFGRLGLLLARKGDPVYAAANTSDLTGRVMRNAWAGVRSCTFQAEITGDGLKKIETLGSGASRQRIAFVNGGVMESLTLGGTYEDREHNKAIGNGGVYMLDEAALIPDRVYGETLRSDFARTDGTSYLQMAISNPHSTGWFYDAITGEADERTLVIWMDALTAVQDGRWTAEKVLKDAERMSDEDITRNLLCELPEAGAGMFPPLSIESTQAGDHIHVLGVDAAYKGKDNICVCDVSISGGKLYAKEVAKIKKTDWIDGVTSDDIADTIARIYHGLDAALCCVDVGFGVWLLEGLLKRGVNAKGINFGAGATKERVKARHYAATNAANLRAEMHLDMQQLMESGQLTWSEQAADAVKGAMPYVTSERKANGKVQVRPKIEIKNLIGHSPDELDAALLAVHAAVLLTSGEY